MSGSFDMTLMFAMHNALRRELAHIAKIAARIDDDPRRILANAAGWEMFKKALYIHHSAEDDALWPAMRQALADRPDDLALLEAMEAEHAAIDPLIESIDAALADRDSGPERVGDLIVALADTLGGPLKHEEDEALPLVEATATARTSRPSRRLWRAFRCRCGRPTGTSDSPPMPPGTTPHRRSSFPAVRYGPRMAVFRSRTCVRVVSRW